LSPRFTFPALLALLVLSHPVPGLSQDGSPAGPVPVEALEARRQSLLAALQGAMALVTSAGPRGDYAQDSDYREANDFFYLTGIEAPAGCLVFNGREPGAVTLYLPPRSPGSERWTGPQLGPGPEARILTGLAEVRSLEELRDDLGRGLAAGTSGDRASSFRLFVSLGDPRLQGAVGSLLPPGAPEVEDLAPLLAELRLRKDPDEIRRIRRAVDITTQAHLEVWRAAEPGVAEYELEAALEYVFRAMGAERVGFPSIVGSGPNATILHYDKNRRRLEEGDLVVVDIGAEFGYYTADLTRTFPASGRFNPRQASLYELVLGARAAGLAVIRPGSTIGDVNLAVRTFLQQSSGGLCGAESCATFLIHGVAHWLGMDVHDVGDNRTPFEAGMVLTLEPGLYLPEEALGIRIEDDILVTEAGYEVLSIELPRTVQEIEAIMAEAPAWIQGPRRDGTLEPTEALGSGASGPPISSKPTERTRNP